MTFITDTIAIGNFVDAENHDEIEAAGIRSRLEAGHRGHSVRNHRPCRKVYQTPHTSLGTLFKGRDEFLSISMFGISMMRNHRHRSSLQEFCLCHSRQ